MSGIVNGRRCAGEKWFAGEGILPVTCCVIVPQPCKASVIAEEYRIRALPGGSGPSAGQTLRKLSRHSAHPLIQVSTSLPSTRHTIPLLLILLLGLTLGWSGLSAAQTWKPDNLYEVSLPVGSQDAEQRDALLGKALAAVLVRLTGDRDIGSDPLASPVIGRASELVQSFGYTSKTMRQPDPLDPQGPPIDTEQLYFRANFDSSAVDEALLAARLPVWGEERPLTAVWIAVRDTDETAMVTDSRAEALGQAAIDTALTRGIGVMLPSLAEIAAAGVGVDELMDGNDGNIIGVSNNLGAQGAAVGRLQRAGAGWQGSWTLLVADAPPEVWDVTGVTLEEVQAEGMHRIADSYAARYSRLSVEQSSGTAYIAIRGMVSASAYARVSNYLESLSIVGAADVFSVDDDTVIYRLELNGDAAQFEQTVGLGNVLMRDWNGGGDPRLLHFVLRETR